MSAIAPDRYNNFGKTSYINLSYIPETFCVGSVGQYISNIVMLRSHYHDQRYDCNRGLNRGLIAALVSAHIKS